MIAWRLPENAVCAILPMLPDGLVRIVYDPAKPDVIEHVYRMLVEQNAEPQPPDQSG